VPPQIDPADSNLSALRAAKPDRGAAHGAPERRDASPKN
jgi:hypothetical protein